MGVIGSQIKILLTLVYNFDERSIHNFCLLRNKNEFYITNYYG